LITRELHPLERVALEIRTALDQYPGAKLSAIGHSFGTYLISRILQEQTDLRFWRIIFCGSVVKQGYHWDRVKERIGDPQDPAKRGCILNECGSGDAWPACAEIGSFRYGSAGTDGFYGAIAKDRCHKGKHSTFLTREFIERNWKPFIYEGIINAGDAKLGSDLKAWFRAARILLSKTALLFYLLLAIVWYNWPAPQRTCDITLPQFLTSYEAKKDDSAELTKWKQVYVGCQVTWEAIVVEIIPHDVSPALKITTGEFKRTVRATFNVDDFRIVEPLEIGAKIRIRGIISSATSRLGPHLDQCEYLGRVP
jgi:hypothetical protein